MDWMTKMSSPRTFSSTFTKVFDPARIDHRDSYARFVGQIYESEVICSGGFHHQMTIGGKLSQELVDLTGGVVDLNDLTSKVGIEFIFCDVDPDALFDKLVHDVEYLDLLTRFLPRLAF